MMLSNRVLIDMDATLYYAPFAEACRVFYGLDCVPSNKIQNWDWYKDKLSAGQFQSVIEFVQSSLMVYKPFALVKQTLNNLKNLGYEIIIISHRPEHHAKIVKKWLVKHEIMFDRVITIPQGKEKYYHRGDIVIDDAPDNIEAAIKVGAHAFSLRYPYNYWVELMYQREAFFGDDWKDLSKLLSNLITMADGNFVIGNV